MNLRHAFAVLRKEFLDAVRDRRSIGMALAFPMVGPAVLSAMVLLAGQTSGNIGPLPQIPVAIVGRENAPGLVEFLQRQRFEVLPGPSDPEGEVRSGRLAVALVIRPTFRSSLRSGVPASVQIITDESRIASRPPTQQLQNAIDNYDRELAGLRVMARGCDPGGVVAIETRDVATPESRAAMLLSIMPYFIIFSVFVGGMYVAIDTTAGERERHSLETLLLNPIERTSLVLGKTLTTMLAGGVALFEALVGFGVLPRLIASRGFAFSLRLDAIVLAKLFFLLLPLLAFASALQIAVGTFSRSFKAAQASLTLLMMLPLIPGTAMVFLPVQAQGWMMVIPTMGEQMLMSLLLRGDPVQSSHVALCMASELTYAFFAGLISVRLFSSEKLLFGR